MIDDYGSPNELAAVDTLAELSKLDPASEDFSTQLYGVKSRFDLAWAALTFSGQIEFRQLGRLRSEFAAKSIDVALNAAWYQTLKQNRVKPVPVAGLFILGLGKLGGNDLNFSSDVDLIAYYDPDTLPISANKGQKYIVNKVLQALTRILKPNHSPQLVWRVDWRLRPESSAGGLALTCQEAVNFYFFRALPWHRLALMKARVVAGDIAVGAAFLTELTPFIWRQNLDYRALDELAHLKSRINLEHPGLQAERAQNVPIHEDPSGFNVKLGSGGIREIEFFANAQQLLWGGKQYELRTSNTMGALKALSDLGHIPEALSQELSAHYVQLRQLENAIQMLWNDQTHIVPDGAEMLISVAALLGAEWPNVSRDVFVARTHVNAAFAKLFHNEADTVEDAPKIPVKFSGATQDIARSWLSGFDLHGVRRNRLQDFQPLGRELLDRLIASTVDSEEALLRIDRFLRSLSRSEQYLHLLQRNPRLLDALITPLLHSPHMTRLLEQSPHIVDVFLEPQSPVNGGADDILPSTEFIFADPDYEMRLERLRRFVNEYLFQYYHQFLHEEADLPALHQRLTRLAAATIDASIQIVRDDLGLDELPMTVLGLGKMGTQRMAPQSDLDLIFIFDDSSEGDISAKVVRRLRTVITTPLREGIAYELDMRLRPSGRSGPPAVKLGSFKDHHMNRAKTWEHIALAHARIVAGAPQIGEKVEALRAEILSRPRDREQFLRDAQVMWRRIADQRITSTPPDIINAKLSTGGLMQAEYLEACLRVIGEPYDNLHAPIQYFSEMQIWERLLGLTGKAMKDVPTRFQSAMFGGQSAARYAKTAKIHQAAVVKAMDALLSGAKLPAAYQERPIAWLD